MKDFIDIEGASGATYRFRCWPKGAPHLPMAGNYVGVREEPSGFTVLVVGESSNLSVWPRELTGADHGGATHVFTRLNVARAIRMAEHADLAARYHLALVAEAAD